MQQISYISGQAGARPAASEKEMGCGGIMLGHNQRKERQNERSS
jgi:hypothetical protein